MLYNIKIHVPEGFIFFGEFDMKIVATLLYTFKKIGFL
jgi:hypothetical protein